MIFQSFSQFIAKEPLTALFICVYSCAENPLDFILFLHEAPWRKQNRGGAQGGRRWPFPARGLAGGVGKVGEKLEGLESYLGVASVGRGTVGGGGAVAAGGRRRR